VAKARGQFENPEEGESLPLEAVTKELVKTMTENTSVCNSDLKLQSRAVSKDAISAVSNQNPVSNHYSHVIIFSQFFVIQYLIS
jgi:hypothetical protein